MLNEVPRLVGVGQRHAASVITEFLDFLQRILLHAGPQGLLGDGVEIDKNVPAQQAVNLVFPRRIAEH